MSDFTSNFHFHALEKEMATHSSILAWESQGQGNLVGWSLWGRTESDTTEATQQQQQQLLKTKWPDMTTYMATSEAQNGSLQRTCGGFEAGDRTKSKEAENSGQNQHDKENLEISPERNIFDDF